MNRDKYLEIEWQRLEVKNKRIFINKFDIDFEVFLKLMRIHFKLI